MLGRCREDHQATSKSKVGLVFGSTYKMMATKFVSSGWRFGGIAKVSCTPPFSGYLSGERQRIKDAQGSNLAPYTREESLQGKKQVCLLLLSTCVMNFPQVLTRVFQLGQ